MSDPTTWRRRKSRRKWPSQVAAFAALVIVGAAASAHAQSFLGGGRSFLRAPLSALGANLLRATTGRQARWPANPNRYGIGSISHIIKHTTVVVEM